MNSRFVCLVVLVCFSAAATLAADKRWVEIRSHNFRVVTNGNPADARHVAREFEQLRYLFATQFPGFRLDSGAPLTIFAVADENTAKELEPRLWKRKGAKPAGEFHSGWEKRFAMVRLDAWQHGAHEVVYHEYTHTLLDLNNHWLPLWLNEGLAEFYGYTRFQEHQIFVGSPTNRFSTLRTGIPIPIQTLITIDQRSPYYHDENKVEMFYAESWALVHFMVFGPEMDRGVKVIEFARLAQQGIEQEKAFEQVFGDFKNIDKALSQYINRFTFAAGVLKSPPQIDEKDFSARVLSMAETEAELGAFHLWNHDLADARYYSERAVKDDPKLGLAHEDMGFVDFAEGKDTEALTEFAQAYALDDKLYLSLFAKTMLSSVSGSNSAAEETQLHEGLNKVLTVDPQFAPAYVQLARYWLRQNDLKAALAASRKAEELEPSRAGYHVLSGYILLRMGRPADAAAFAKYVAERWFGADHDEAIELWNSVPSEQRSRDVLSDVAAKDTVTAIGTVKSVTCSEQDGGIALVINHDGHNLTFRRKRPVEGGFSDTVWYGADHFSFCHHVDGMRAVVRYRPATDPNYTGDIAELQIRDDLPAALSTSTAEAATGTK